MDVVKVSNRNLILTVCVFVCLGSVLAPSHAQQDAARPQARRVLTYDDKIGGSEAEQWHLEDFRELLLKETNSQVCIIAYNGRDDNPGKARRYALRARTYLVESRGIPPQRIVTVEGGRREEFVVELWLVPAGAKIPEPTATITEQTDMGDNLLYDSYSPGYDNFAKYEHGEARLDGFALALKKEPAAWACVLSYAQNGDDRVGIEWDLPQTAQKTSQGVKNYLVRQHGIAPERISAVDGGYSEGRVVELWVMRPAARFDRGPFVYPHRLKAGRRATLTIDNREAPDFCCRACERSEAQPKRNAHRKRK